MLLAHLAATLVIIGKVLDKKKAQYARIFLFELSKRPSLSNDY